MNTIKMLGGLSAMAVTATMLIAAPAHAGEGASLVVTGTAIGKASSDGAIYGSTRLTVGGATQLTWEDSDHDLRVTRSQIRNAPKFKINAPGANSSKMIYKKAKQKNDGDAAKIVVLKKGSVIRNTGRLNLLLRGFKFTLPHDTVVVLDKKTKQYRIAYYIIGGKLVKQCGNYIGGNVPMEDKVVQVQHEEDVQLNGVAKAVAEVPISVSFKLTCPNGASFNVNAWAKAYGAATNTVSYTLRTQASTVASIKLEAEKNIVINQDVYAEAGAGINVKATCGEDTPPPPPPPPVVPAYSCDTLSATKGDNRSVTISNFSTTQSGGATFKRAEVNWGDGSAVQNFTSPVGQRHAYQGDGPFTITATAVFDVNGVEMKVTSPNCQTAVKFDTIVNPPTLDTIVKVNDVIEYADRTIRITGTVPAGRRAILLSNTCNGGTITSNQRVEVTGSFTVDIGYKAGEVPAQNTDAGCEVVAGSERLNVKLTDTVDSTLMDTKYTTFRIIPRPPTPDAA